MKTRFGFSILCLFGNLINVHAAPIDKTAQMNIRSCPVLPSTVEEDARAIFQYFLEEVEMDPILTHEEQQEKVLEFKKFADHLSPDVADLVIDLLLKETRSRIIDMLQKAALDDLEIQACLADYEIAIHGVQDMNIEIAREMLFFVAELKIHRQYVYDFGVALGCPEKQLLHHDLCKLSASQFEGYARYFRGGKTEKDKPGYIAAWAVHQHEEHHCESYRKEGFNFDNFPEERIRNNMLESVADILASAKQRGGSTLIEWLVKSFPKKNPHPRLLPYVEEGLMKAHAFYVDSEANPDSTHSIFKGLPCWNDTIAEVFRHMKEGA